MTRIILTEHLVLGLDTEELFLRFPDGHLMSIGQFGMDNGMCPRHCVDEWERIKAERYRILALREVER